MRVGFEWDKNSVLLNLAGAGPRLLTLRYLAQGASAAGF